MFTLFLSKMMKKQKIYFPIRYFVLILICAYSIGFMGVNDTPGSLQDAIMTKFNADTFKFALLFSLSAWPSCFGFINGFIIDKYLGVRLATFIFIIVLTIGNALFLVGFLINNFLLLNVGRFLYGLGADPLMLCLNTFILHWFSASNELNMVFAMVTSLSWIGSSLVFFMSNRIYEYAETNNYGQPLGIAMSGSMIFTAMMALSTLILGFMYKPPRAINNNPDKNEPTTNWKDIFNFSLTFWLFTILVNLYFLSVMAFLMMSQKFFSERYNLSLNAASNMASTFSLVTCVLSPSLGFLVDKIGRNLVFVTISILFGLIAHGMMAFSTSNPFATVIILSLSYSMMTASYLPLISYLVEKHQTATAYGIAQSGMNGSFAIGSLIVGKITSMYGYVTEEQCYFFLILGTIPFWMILWIINLTSGNQLNMSSYQKQCSNAVKNIDNRDTKEKELVACPIGLSTPPTMKKSDQLAKNKESIANY